MTMDKEEALKRIKIIEEEDHELQRIIDTPEKPKIRLGDFGIVPRGENKQASRPVLADSQDLTDWGYWLDENGDDSCRYDSANGEKITNTGNIFDMLKEWSEDLTKFMVDNDRFELDLKDAKNPFMIRGAWFAQSEAEEIWQKLGQMIATLKRKGKHNED